MYFSVEGIERDMERKRGWFATVKFDKADGEERVYSGVICKSKGQFMLNIGELEQPVFKAFNHARVKEVKIDGMTYRPKEKVNEAR